MKFPFFTCKFVGNNFIANRIMVSRFHSSFFTDAGAYESWASDIHLDGGGHNGNEGGGGVGWRGTSLYPNTEKPVKFHDFVDLYLR